MDDAGTPGAVARAFADALVAAEWGRAAELLRPDARWEVDGGDALRGRDAIRARLVAEARSMSLAGPLRVTRGSEVAWPATESAELDATARRPRVDIVDVSDDGLIVSWTTLLPAPPSARTEARREALLAYVERVGRADSEAALALFASECRVEDPVGTPAHEGRTAVESFYRSGLGAITGTALLGDPVVGAGRLGAVPFRVTLQLPDRAIALEVVDVMAFDQHDAFTSMRAFWGRHNRLSA